MGIPERKLRAYETRRKLILDSSKKLFQQKGFHAVTLDDIAGEIEFSKGTIYSHFSSKEEIYAHILLEHLLLLHHRLQEAADANDDFETGIRRCLHVYLDFYHQHHEYFRLLFFVGIFGNPLRIPETTIKELQYRKLACLKALEKVIKKSSLAQKNGGFVSSKYLSLVLWGMLNGIIQLADARQIKEGDLDELITVAYDIVVSGLHTAKPRRLGNGPV